MNRFTNDRHTQQNPLNYESPDSDFLYGVTKEGLIIYWRGPDGSRKVILRKVNADYQSISGKEFDILMKDKETVLKPKDLLDEYPNGLKNLTSSSSGVFFCGVLPYGTYYIHEKDPEKYFKLIIDEKGVVEEKTENGKTVTKPTKELR